MKILQIKRELNSFKDKISTYYFLHERFKSGTKDFNIRHALPNKENWAKTRKWSGSTKNCYQNAWYYPITSKNAPHYNFNSNKNNANRPCIIIGLMTETSAKKIPNGGQYIFKQGSKRTASLPEENLAIIIQINKGSTQGLCKEIIKNGFEAQIIHFTNLKQE